MCIPIGIAAVVAMILVVIALAILCCCKKKIKNNCCKKNRKKRELFDSKRGHVQQTVERKQETEPLIKREREVEMAEHSFSYTESKFILLQKMCLERNVVVVFLNRGE